MEETPIFNETKLREEIVKVWGAYGAHTEVYDMLIRKAEKQNIEDVAIKLLEYLYSEYGIDLQQPNEETAKQFAQNVAR